MNNIKLAEGCGIVLGAQSLQLLGFAALHAQKWEVKSLNEETGRGASTLARFQVVAHIQLVKYLVRLWLIQGRMSLINDHGFSIHSLSMKGDNNFEVCYKVTWMPRWRSQG
ncbi:hypothetical protein PPACK8108_LOCUS26047 [Phakopsora pachyrhizi]|uniref:Uncharacterized protein n=1 Tax=Phakopsora pachyrhizi TaxID=170000 RepID=A0AAV0B1Z4_PHAPC|nr:hypothetical protein PPACK8108_LOCUS12457 [Phakopsora pachyrhizi]CAH7690637.1 hypothetical protein PPACK8108_LOCUS26047 [Phakopsora pachyrhizi]